MELASFPLYVARKAEDEGVAVAARVLEEFDRSEGHRGGGGQATARGFQDVNGLRLERWPGLGRN